MASSSYPSFEKLVCLHIRRCIRCARQGSDALQEVYPSYSYLCSYMTDAKRRLGTALTIRGGRQHLPLQKPVQLSATYLLKTSTAELARQHIDIFAEVDETRDVARTRTVSSDFPRLSSVLKLVILSSPLIHPFLYRVIIQAQI